MVVNTFYMDFTIAEHFGIDAIKDTFKRCHEWLCDVEYWGALCYALNAKCWHWYEKGNELASTLYADLYHAAVDEGYDTFKGADAKRFFDIVD